MLYLYEATGVRDRIGRRTKKSPASRVCVKNSGIDRSVGNRGHRIDFALDLKTNRRYVGEERRHDCRRGTPGGARHKTLTTTIFMARAWAIGPWTLLIVAAPFQVLGIHQDKQSRDHRER